MSDTNVFAILRPYDTKDRARNAFRLQENAHCNSKAAECIAEGPTIGSREPTPARSSSPEINYDCIILRLDKPPKDPSKGWQFGTNPRVSDVLLGHRGTTNISGRHFYITITEQLRVELHENSRFGTAVGYNGKVKDLVLKDDKWLLSFEPAAKNPWYEVVIHVPDQHGLSFKIEFPNHSIGGQEYLENLSAFVEESRKALPSVSGLVSGLGLDSNPSTAPLSGQSHNPSKRPIYFDDEEIGNGAFGHVWRVFDLREGHVYAAKYFTPQDSKKSDLEAIRNEVKIMKENPHPNVMEVIDYQEEPRIRLVMPYYPRGSLERAENFKFNYAQHLSIFRQILLGLRHLHGNGVAHRDLKPANLLVADPLRIIISDFGLSKLVPTDGLLTSAVGTYFYMAPEVARAYAGGQSRGYGPEVDIWAAGVIMLELMFGLPNKYAAGNWLDHLDERFTALQEKYEYENKVLEFLELLITLKGEDRSKADQCLEEGCKRGLFIKGRGGQILDADDTSEDVATAVVTEAVASDDGSATPTQQLSQRTEKRASRGSDAPTT